MLDFRPQVSYFEGGGILLAYRATMIRLFCVLRQTTENIETRFYISYKTPFSGFSGKFCHFQSLIVLLEANFQSILRVNYLKIAGNIKRS